MTGMRSIGRGTVAVLAALTASALTANALAGTAPAARADGPWHGEPAAYGVSNPTQHLVTMSDGVPVAVDVYVPTQANGSPAPGRFGVILSQTPYNKRSPVTTQSMGSGFGGDGFYPYL